jgi:hypothetical protein
MIEIFESFNLSLIVSILEKALMIMFTVLAALLVRQVSMMNRVVNVSIGNWFSLIVWGYFFSVIVATGIVLLV